jgi:DNA-binding response OmpR family regulator
MLVRHAARQLREKTRRQRWHDACSLLVAMARRFSEHAPRPTTLAEAWRATHRQRILIADDDESLSRALERALQRMGIDVLAVSRRGELEARLLPERWRQHQCEVAPDLIVLGDLPPAGCGGIESLRRLRVVDRHTPVLLFSSNESPAAHLEAARLGVAAYLHKPLSLDELVSLIVCLLEAGTNHAA